MLIVQQVSLHVEAEVNICFGKYGVGCASGKAFASFEHKQFVAVSRRLINIVFDDDHGAALLGKHL